MTRCEFTDLEASMCAHCRPAPQPPAGGHTSPAEPGTLPPQQRPWFTALYSGRCAACGTPYTPDPPRSTPRLARPVLPQHLTDRAGAPT